MSAEEKLRGYLRRVTGELLETREQLAAAQGGEPIAIVGMACRFPGGVSTPEDLWELLERGGYVAGDLPKDRNWNLDELADGPRGYGGFLADAAEFDAEFFEISPREAAAMDPQHRLLLETTWEALERAGIAPDSLRGSKTGAYVGIISGDYAAGVAASTRGTSGQGGFFINGAGAAFASGRIAYALGLQGPAVTFDTACSSALVALHDACQGLRHGDCTLAVVGAGAVMATSATLVEFIRQGGLAPDGRCKPFGAAANGTAFAEGAGVLVLERLSDARRAGHEVLAVVRGSAVNSDGASNGITAPNGAAQKQVIRQALANARLAPAQVDAVEAHGTGTTLGDPIEARALLGTYGEARPAERPLLVGSVKSNLGHTQAVAGLAGVVKMVLALRHGVLPASLGIDRPTPHVDWSSGTVELLTEARPWPATDEPRRAGISSFSLSGTNAHVIIEQAPAADIEPISPTPLVAVPFVLSAKSAPALRAQASRLLRRLDESAVSDVDVAYSLATGRAGLRHRAVVVGTDRDALVDGLTALAGNADAPNVVRGSAGGTNGAVFVFPGQGQQWVGMGAQLLESSPVFAARVNECVAAFAPYLDWSLLDVLRGVTGARGLDEDEVIQVALFTMMVSLSALWASLGVRPVAVVGHSQGEFAAACVAGALSLPEAARIVALRNRPVRARVTGRGGMASVARPVAEVAQLLRARWGERLTVAAINGPAATAVSGDLDALTEFIALCAEQSTPAQRIPIAYASHSAQVDAIETELLDTLGTVEAGDGDIPFYSTVTAGPVAGRELTAPYWFENLRRPVDFAGTIRALLADGHRTFVECGAHPSLALGLTDLAEQDGADATVVSTLRRDDGGLDRFLRAAAQLHVCGGRVDWPALLAPSAPRRVALPTYPFQRQRFWLDAPANNAVRAAGLHAAEHPLLDATLDLAGSGTLVLLGRISVADQPWLADHTVAGTVLLPGTACVELATHAAASAGLGRLAELTLSAPMVVPAADLTVQVTVGAATESGPGPVTVHSRPTGSDDAWTEHATGFADDESVELKDFPASWPPADAAIVDLDGAYDRLAGFGFGYGPAFHGLRALWRRDGELLAEVALPVEPGGFDLHPALFDAALHAFLVDRLDTRSAGDDLLLPFAWRGVTVTARGATSLRVRIAPGATSEELRLDATDEQGAPVLAVESLTLRPVAAEQLRARNTDALYRLDRIPVSALGEPPLPTRCAVLGTDGPDIGTRYADLAELDAAARLPEVVFAPVSTVGAALRLVKDWLVGQRFADARLVLLTASDIAGAAVRGLMRSAQAEHPGRFVIIDGDASIDTLLAAIATQEPETAVRSGALLAPRLVRVTATTARAAAPLSGTALVTGGLGTLGGLLARHLVTARGARRLMLVGRRGEQTPGAAELVAELRELGATVTVAACDVGDRAALGEVIAAVPAEHPLTAVFHVAGVADDGVLTALDGDRLDRVLRPKLDAALHLHELTRGQELSDFVLFSSLAGVLGNPGQGNYAAANAGLDALAEHRRALGLPAQSLAWGLWADESAVTSGLAAARPTEGAIAMSATEALALFDAATATDLPVVAPALLDFAALRAAPELPPVLRSLVPSRTGSRRAAPVEESWQAELAGLGAEDRLRRLVELVIAKVAVVLGHTRTGGAGIEADRAFKELGFDSLTAVELRNQLAASTGLRLPPTLVFDYPTPTDLAAFLDTQVAEPVEQPADPVQAAVEQLRSAVAAQRLGEDARGALTDRVRDLLREWSVESDRPSVEITSASAQELFDLLDEQLGTS